MKIKSVVIHEITKNTGETHAEMYLSQKEEDASHEKVREIVTEINQSFVKKAITRAKFGDDSAFQQEIPSFQNYSILDVSQKLIRRLKDMIGGIAPAKGGYLVFAEFKDQNDFLGVFMLRNKNGTMLQRAGDGWDFNSTKYVDTEHFAMGVKINLSILNTTGSDDRYISLVKGYQDISHYFQEWVGIDKDSSTNEKKDSNALYRLVTQILDLPEGIETRDQFMKAVHSHVDALPGKIVHLKALSAHFYNDEDYIQGMVPSDMDINSRFKMANDVLNRLSRVKIIAGGIELAMNREMFSNKEMIDCTGDTVIIRSAELAEMVDREKKLESGNTDTN